ncbi:MAG TPA: hypothetical protein VNL70_07935 [Tepidisphaeraceae bacterium]|nr:hypothetical protein [Tepidisphaeraceae bacterium]
MSRHDLSAIQRYDGQELDLSLASGEELLLLAVLGGARARRQVHQELGRRTFGAAAGRPPRRMARHATRVRLAA